MPGTHFTAAQVQHAERQLSAGVRWRQVRSNQRTVFGSRASVPSRASLFRWRRRGPRSAQALRCRRVFPGRTLTRRQKRLLREAMERSSQTRTSELSAMLGREVNCGVRRVSSLATELNTACLDAAVFWPLGSHC